MYYGDFHSSYLSRLPAKTLLKELVEAGSRRTGGDVLDIVDVIERYYFFLSLSLSLHIIWPRFWSVTLSVVVVDIVDVVVVVLAA